VKLAYSVCRAHLIYKGCQPLHCFIRVFDPLQSAFLVVGRLRVRGYELYLADWKPLFTDILSVDFTAVSNPARWN